MRARDRAGRCLVLMTVVWVWCWELPPSSAAAPETPPERAVLQPRLSRVQSYYEVTRFDDAISLLRDLVGRGVLHGEPLLKARVLLARAYIKKGYVDLGRAEFETVLRQRPSWRPDPGRIPPDEIAVFRQALAASRIHPGPGGAGGATSSAPAPRVPRIPADPGVVAVRVTPFGAVFVDDTLRRDSVSSSRFELSPGLHEVRVTHPVCEPQVWKVVVESARSLTLAHDFPVGSVVAVRVTSGGVWARVFVDGEDTGLYTPCIVRGLSPGRHTIRVERKGFSVEGRGRIADIRAGEVATAAFRLRPVPR
jgi:hypothetical protein